MSPPAKPGRWRRVQGLSVERCLETGGSGSSGEGDRGESVRRRGESVRWSSLRGGRCPSEQLLGGLTCGIPRAQTCETHTHTHSTAHGCPTADTNAHVAARLDARTCRSAYSDTNSVHDTRQLRGAPLRRQLFVWAGDTEVVGEVNPAVLHRKQCGTRTCRELGTPEFFGHRLKTSMTRATVDDGTAGLGQTLRTRSPPWREISGRGVMVAWVIASVASQVVWVGECARSSSPPVHQSPWPIGGQMEFAQGHVPWASFLRH